MKHLRLMQGPLILINHIPGSDIQSLLRYVQSRAAERVPFVAFKSLPPNGCCNPMPLFACCHQRWVFLMSASSDFYLPGFLFIMMGLFFLGDSRIFNVWSCLCILFDNLSFFGARQLVCFDLLQTCCQLCMQLKAWKRKK